MKSRIKSIFPQMDGGEQRTYTGQHGVMYCFECTLEDGTRGQVSSKSPAPHRFGPGDEVDYTFTPGQKPTHLGRLKIEKPKDAAPPSNGEQRGWSPAKEASVMIQGLLKSIIEGGTESKHWADALDKALTIHDAALAKRMQPAQEPEPAY